MGWVEGPPSFSNKENPESGETGVHELGDGEEVKYGRRSGDLHLNRRPGDEALTKKPDMQLFITLRTGAEDIVVALDTSMLLAAKALDLGLPLPFNPMHPEIVAMLEWVRDQIGEERDRLIRVIEKSQNTSRLVAEANRNMRDDQLEALLGNVTRKQGRLESMLADLKVIVEALPVEGRTELNTIYTQLCGFRENTGKIIKMVRERKLESATPDFIQETLNNPLSSGDLEISSGKDWAERVKEIQSLADSLRQTLSIIVRIYS